MAAQVKWYGEQVATTVKGQTAKRLARLGAEMERYIKTHFTVPGDWRPYDRPGGRIHWSARPGLPPAVDYGRLRASITFNVSGSGVARAPIENRVPRSKADDGVGAPPKAKGRTVLVVGTNVKYGKYLEFGSPRCAPRPFLRPTFEHFLPRILAYFGGMVGARNIGTSYDSYSEGWIPAGRSGGAVWGSLDDPFKG